MRRQLNVAPINVLGRSLPDPCCTLQAGFTTFDMADHYGSAEEIVGRYNHKVKEVQNMVRSLAAQKGSTSTPESTVQAR